MKALYKTIIAETQTKENFTSSEVCELLADSIRTITMQTISSTDISPIHNVTDGNAETKDKVNSTGTRFEKVAEFGIKVSD